VRGKYLTEHAIRLIVFLSPVSVKGMMKSSVMEQEASVGSVNIQINRRQLTFGVGNRYLEEFDLVFPFGWLITFVSDHSLSPYSLQIPRSFNN
jgi:hypothetical protein